MEPKGKGRDLREYVQVLRKRWVAVVGVFALGVGLSAFYIQRLPKIYEAIGVVVVPQGRASSWLDTAPVAALSGSQARAPQLSLETAAQLARSRMYALETARRWGSKYEQHHGDPRRKIPPPLSAQEIVGSLVAEAIAPDRIIIRARHTSPLTATLLANETANVFCDKRRLAAVDEAHNELRFINKALAQVEEEQRKITGEIARFQEENHIYALDRDVEERFRMMNEHIMTRDAAVAAYQSAQQQIKDLQRQLAKESKVQVLPTYEDDPQIKHMQEALAEAEKALIEAQSKYTEGHLAVADARDFRDTFKAKLKDLMEQRPKVPVDKYLPNPHYQDLRKELLSAQTHALEAEATRMALDQVIASERQEMGALPAKQQQLADLLRRVKVEEQTHSILLQKKWQVQLEAQKPTGGAFVGDYAFEPRSPVAPRKTQLLILAALAAFALGITAALVWEHLDTAVHNPQEVSKHLGITSLGFIPDMGRRNGSRQLVVLTDPRSPVSEAYRTLRSNLKYTCLDHPIHTLLVTSTREGEGKSCTAANLALTLAEAGQQVILVDADLRRPTMHLHFDRDGDAGLTTVLVGETEVDAALRDTPMPNLRLLPSGPLPPNPAELLESERMAQVLQQLSTMADYVIVDAPPILAVTDASVLSSKTDGTLLVVLASKIPREAAQSALQTIQHARGKVLGAVLNRVKVTRGSQYYYYYRYAENGRRRAARGGR